MFRLLIFIFGISLATASFAGKISRVKTVKLNVQKVILLDVSFEVQDNDAGSSNINGKLLIKKNTHGNPTWVTLMDAKFLDKQMNKMVALVVFPDGHLECIETIDTSKTQKKDAPPRKLATEKILHCSECHTDLATFQAGFEGDPFEYWRKTNGDNCPCCEHELDFKDVNK